ncbi:hypothetical protein GCM10020295_45610 [Streptomyces cinereospinus]
MVQFSGGDLGQSDPADLAFGPHVPQRAELVGERRLWIDAVQLKQLDPLDAQSAQSLLDLIAQNSRPPIGLPLTRRARSSNADLGGQVVQEFRANHGRVGGRFEGARLILLTTTGARSGAEHTTPVAYLPDGAGRILVIASAGGSPRHPAWYHNLLAHPRVTVESGVFTYRARAVVLRGEERDQAFARAVETDPGWAAYQEKAGRVIPVVALHEIAGDGPPDIDAGSLGEAIKVVHDGFRRELGLIRQEMERSAGKAGTLGAQLRANCLTFCHGLHHHHTGEDLGLFPFLADRYPRPPPSSPASARSTSVSRPSSRSCARRSRRRTRSPPAPRWSASAGNWRLIWSSRRSS